MGAPATYVWTHDSIGLGEDGPTHQPIEHLAALRAIPGLSIVRPADANETAYAWRAILERQHDWFCGPVGLCLTRQAVPVLEGTDYEGVHRGAYVLAEADGDLQVILHGDRLRGADRGAGAGGVAGRGHRHPRGVRAVPGLVRGAGRGVHRRRSCRRTSPRGCPSRPRSRSRGGVGSARTAGPCPSSTTARPPTSRPCTRSSASPPKQPSPRRSSRWPPPGGGRGPSSEPHAEKMDHAGVDDPVVAPRPAPN